MSRAHWCSGCAGIGPAGKPAPVFPIQVQPADKLQPAAVDGYTAADSREGARNAVSPVAPAVREIRPVQPSSPACTSSGGSPAAPVSSGPTSISPIKALPVEKPRTTSDRDRVSATGYGDKDQDEPTQELPNPLDSGTIQKIETLKAPVMKPVQTR